MVRSLQWIPGGLALAALSVLALVHLTSRWSGPVTLESFVGSRVENGVPVFDWSDTHNVNMFNQACAQGNQMACEELAGHQDALNELNRQGRAHVHWGSSFISDKPGSSAYDKFRVMGDEMVDLDDRYEIANELQGSDLGNTMVPEEDVAFKHMDDDRTDLTPEKEIERDQVSSFPRAAFKVYRGQELRGMAPLSDRVQEQGLGLMVPAEQQRRVQSLVVDLCGPGSPFCGPTRPEDAHNADVVLTEPDEYGGWLGVEAAECCPCLGKGARRIGYDQFEHNGFYNPYTMNLCRRCGVC